MDLQNATAGFLWLASVFYSGCDRSGPAESRSLLMPPSCSSLRAELASLERKGGKNSNGLDRQIRNLETRAQKAGCFRGAVARKSPQCGRMLSRLQRLSHQQVGAPNRNVAERRASLRHAITRVCGRHEGNQTREASLRGGEYRTLCVRSCDGYYFPINFSTRRDRIQDRRRVLQAALWGRSSRTLRPPH